jgi:hypothetical protein
MIDGVVKLLQDGLADLPAQALGWRRWVLPDPGWSVVVATEGSSWASGPASVRYPTLLVEITTRPNVDQSDAEELGETIVAAIIPLLHWTDNRFRRLADGTRVLGSQLAGESGPGPVEGRNVDAWCWRRLTFELLII